VDYTPDLLLALHIAYQHRQQFSNIHPVGFHSSSSPIYFDAGGINHQVRHFMCSQIAMQPKTISPRFVAAQQWRTLLQTKAHFAQVDLLQ
jgi:hypothetical protein